MECFAFASKVYYFVFSFYLYSLDVIYRRFFFFFVTEQSLINSVHPAWVSRAVPVFAARMLVPDLGGLLQERIKYQQSNQSAAKKFAD